jgi:CDP-diacylglycerol--glycerol-3-phosphate 3-phosphatidyltransferase
MGDRIWNGSNFLSFFRIILVIPIAMLVLGNDPEYRYYAVGLIVVATFTDLFDGMLARRLNQVTEFGKIIDPLADKIAVVVIVVILAQQGKIPSWYLLAAAGRDVLILIGGIYIKNVKGIVVQSNAAGKWAVTAVAMFVLVVILDIPTIEWLKNSLMIMSLVLLVISFTLYVQRFVHVFSAPAQD